MDEELSLDERPLQVRPAQESVALGHEDHHLEALPAPSSELADSQLTQGAPQGEPVEPVSIPVKPPDDPSHTS